VWEAKRDIEVIETTAATLPVSDENRSRGLGGPGGGKLLILPPVLGSVTDLVSVH
jgi:hypothetical protein